MFVTVPFVMLIHGNHVNSHVPCYFLCGSRRALEARGRLFVSLCSCLLIGSFGAGGEGERGAGREGE